MKFINKTKNSVYLEDVGISIDYTEESPQYIDTEIVKKSFAFQKMVSMGCFFVVEASEDRIEKNLYTISQKARMQEAVDLPRSNSGEAIEAIVRGHFYDATGYSKVNRNLAICLKRNGINVEIDPVTINNNTLNELEARILSMLRKPVGKEAIRIDSVIPTQGRVFRDFYNILYTTAECKFVPKQFIDISNDYNELWVTSNFSKDSFINSGYKGNIKVIHPIINVNLYKENITPILFRPNLKSFSFLSVQSWGYRKGSDALLRAFCSAFTDKDDVSLVILISERSLIQRDKIKKEIDLITREYSNKPHICICTKQVPEYQLPSFYKSFNAFVLPSRGEGFGLIYCEASLCGLPVISTNYGGCLDFLNKDNSYLVDFDNFEVAEKGKTGIHYWDGQEFPNLDKKFITNLADIMKYVVNNYKESKNKNKILQSEIIRKFDGTFAGKEMKQILDNIWLKERKNDSHC